MLIFLTDNFLTIIMVMLWVLGLSFVALISILVMDSVKLVRKILKKKNEKN